MGEHERAAQAARQGVVSAREYGLARATGTLLAANVAEPLMSLGRWDEADEVIEHALDLSPPLGTRAVLLLLTGQMALARGDLARAAQSATASRGALAGTATGTRPTCCWPGLRPACAWRRTVLGMH